MPMTARIPMRLDPATFAKRVKADCALWPDAHIPRIRKRTRRIPAPQAFATLCARVTRPLPVPVAVQRDTARRMFAPPMP